MSEFGNTLSVVIGINLILILAQIGISDMSGDNIYVNCNQSILSIGGCSQVNTNDAFGSSGIPTATVSSSGGSSSGFTDVFNAIGNWFRSGFGAEILGYVFALYPILYMTGLPSSFVIIIGSAWYLITFFAVIEWWRGIG